MAKSTLLLLPYIGLVAFVGELPPDAQPKSFAADLEYVRDAIAKGGSNSVLEISKEKLDPSQHKSKKLAQQWNNWNNTFNRAPKPPPA